MSILALRSTGGRRRAERRVSAAARTSEGRAMIVRVTPVSATVGVEFAGEEAIA
jgi:hypothetical protein